MLRSLLSQSATIAVAFAGGGAASALGAPAGWMSGAMIATMLFAAIGQAAQLATPLRNAVIVLAGASMGSGANPQALRALAHYPLSLALMTLAVAAMTWASAAVLARAPGFSRMTALYAAVPGALSYVIIQAEAAGADIPRIAATQVFRLFVLMAIVPLIAGHFAPPMPTGPLLHDSLATTAALLGAAGLASLALGRLGVPSAPLYAAIGVSVLAHGSGLAPGRPLPSVQIVAQALIGAWVGARFIGFDWSLMRRLLAVAGAAFLAALAVAAAFAALTALLIGAPFVQVLVAFAPGGIEATTMMAFAFGLDPLFIGAHHLARFLLIAAALPGVGRGLDRRQ